jgi:phosphocarrier protein
MRQEETTIVNKLGLHARAATRLVSCASAFESEIWISKGEKRVNGKSIMGVLTLAAARGTELLIEADGPDEDSAIGALVELIADFFGEGE